MVLAIIFTALLVIIAGYFLRPRKIVKLSKLCAKRLGKSFIWHKINIEIKIFNKMNIIIPSRKGVPHSVIEWLGFLNTDPRKITKSRDSFERLMYLYAAASLYSSSKDQLVRRQLLKNCIYVFGLRDRRVIRGFKLCLRKFYAVRQPAFKFLQGAAFTRIIPRAKNIRFANSYAITNFNGTEIKSYVDKVLPVECSEINGKQKFTFHTEKQRDSVGIADIIRSRGGRLDYLQTEQEIMHTRDLEYLYAKAYYSRFVIGEKLKECRIAAMRYVPTLDLPTLIYSVNDPLELFKVIDQFESFRQMARSGGRINVIVIWTSQDEVFKKYVAAFTNHRDVRTLIEHGVLLFFINKEKLHLDAMTYFLKMHENKVHRMHGTGCAVDLKFFCIVARKNMSYCVVNLQSGTSKYKRLPANAVLTDEFGRVIERGREVVSRKIHI